MKLLSLFAPILLALLPTPAPAQSRLVTEQIRSESFSHSRIGISPTRNLTIYLPPGYRDTRRRFPTLYLLNHFFEDHRAPFAEQGAAALLDKAIAEGVIGDVIVVTADFSTPAGSSWFVNSPVTGNWEDFMVRELVPHIDAAYRTLASRDSRGILGDSVGAYGAIRFGMRHPELFGAVYAMQAVGTGPGMQTTHSRPDFEMLARARSLDEVEGFSRIFTSIYQAFSPNPARPPLYFDPLVRRTGDRAEVDSETVARFHERMDLFGMIPAHAANLKSLRGFKLDWGRMDGIADHIAGNQAFSRQLAEFGVPHEAEEHDGGFRDRHWGERGRVFTDALPFFARRLLFGPPVTPFDKVVAAHGKLGAALVANDVEALVGLYRPDARSMPDYQPALHGPGQIAAYHRAMIARRRVTHYAPVTGEVIDLGGGTLVETGSFTIGWANGAEERGKFANVWAVERDGRLRLKADVRGYFRPLPDAAAHFVALPESVPAPRTLSADEQRLSDVLAARNARNAVAVRAHDAEAKITDYAEDAVYMPFADMPQVGLPAIRAHLTAYTEAGGGATFPSVEVWNTGFEDFGAYVLEYPKFRVAWQSGGASGIVKGGGLRLWKRIPDGTLKLYRQIGTHDHVE